jgi:hypothetical protein
LLLPDKHIKLAESLIGLGGFVLETLIEPKTIDEIWLDFQKNYHNDQYPAYHSFDNLILTIDFLFTVNAINIDTKDKLFICD